MPENNSANGRLDSWKEIADYLKRDVRTAIRWEKERGLPIHRVPGGKRQAVFAYQQEIDDWLSSEGGEEQPSENGKEPMPEENLADVGTAAPHFYAAASDSGEKRFVTLRQRRMQVAILCLLAIIGLGGWFMRPAQSGSLRVVGLKKLTDDGRVKSSLRSDGTTLYFNELNGTRSILASAPYSGGPIRFLDVPFSSVTLMDLSKDGKTLLFIEDSGLMIEGPLWVMPSQGGTPHRIGEAVCNFARWSPDNSQIACAHGTTITVMDADGRNTRAVAAFSLPVGTLAWNPDGRQLRFVLEQAGAHTTSQWEIDVGDGGNTPQARPLELGPNCCYEWTWTRDGKYFVYTDVGNGKSHLKIQMGGASSHSYELPINIGTLYTAVSGAGSDSLFLTIHDTYRGELLKYDRERQVLDTYLSGISGEFIAFSPDRQWITYTRTQDSTLWRSRVDGSDALQLTRPPIQVEVSSWSPDGRRIAFMACTPGQPWRIYVIGRDGGPMQEIAEGIDSQGGPSWSPDGRFIVYANVDCEKTQECRVRRVDLASHTSEIIPGSNGFRTSRCSPDGRYIAALRFQTHEVMLFDIATQRWRVLADSVTGDNINWASDSQSLYVDSPKDKRPVVEQLQIKDGQRKTVISLDSLMRTPGTISPWIGLTPDNAPILSHLFTSAEVYELKWTDR